MLGFDNCCIFDFDVLVLRSQDFLLALNKLKLYTAILMSLHMRVCAGISTCRPKENVAVTPSKQVKYRFIHTAMMKYSYASSHWSTFAPSCLLRFVVGAREPLFNIAAAMFCIRLNTFTEYVLHSN